jgi:hypothetical protein
VEAGGVRTVFTYGGVSDAAVEQPTTVIYHRQASRGLTRNVSTYELP